MINKKEYALWDTFNSLRGRMDISDFKDYILSLLFYKYLSEKNIIDLQSIDELVKKRTILLLYFKIIFLK